MPSPDDPLVFVADEDMRYVAVNDTACEVLGYTRDELLGLRVTDVAVAPEAADLYRDMIEERTQLGMTLLHAKDGTPLPFHYFAQESSEGPYFVAAGFVGEETAWRRPGSPSAEDAEERRSIVLAEVNERIYELVTDLRDRDLVHWEFLCECGRSACNARVVIPLGDHAAARRRDEPLVAQGHEIALARRARRVATELS